ncbi:MAG: hypothetical protein LZF60_280064 [Nitrospira sp.]|nr:MAG: hypothetical protein LZF60_280064 [Nitrospira sp.]
MTDSAVGATVSTAKVFIPDLAKLMLVGVNELLYAVQL